MTDVLNVTLLLSVLIFTFIFIFLKTVDKTLLCKLLTKIKRKQYGLVGLVKHGRLLVFLIKCFDGDIIKINKKTYFLQRNLILEASTQQCHSLNEKIFMFSGVPVAFFDVDDMLPLKFENLKLGEFISRLPEHVTAILDKEISLAEAEIMSSERKKFVRYILFIFLILLIGVGLSVLIYLSLQNLFPIVNEILENVKAILTVKTT